MSYLIDTNIISELTRPVPHEAVLDFMNQLDEGYLSIITVHELTYGIERKPKGKAKNQLSLMVNDMMTLFEKHIIPIDQKEAVTAGELRAAAQNQGRTVHMADALIAATASIRSLTVATRNSKDFAGLGIEVFNPWVC